MHDMDPYVCCRHRTPDARPWHASMLFSTSARQSPGGPVDGGDQQRWRRRATRTRGEGVLPILQLKPSRLDLRMRRRRQCSSAAHTSQLVCIADRDRTRIHTGRDPNGARRIDDPLSLVGHALYSMTPRRRSRTVCMHPLRGRGTLGAGWAAGAASRVARPPRPAPGAARAVTSPGSCLVPGGGGGEEEEGPVR